MFFIPAIDLINGRCVRLIQGNYSKKIVYSKDPVDMALFLQDEGAEFIHIVDLDAARDGSYGNIAVIEIIVKAVNIPVEVGGGVRDKDRIKRLLDSGVTRVVLGTIIVKDEALTIEIVKEFRKNVVAGIDSKNGMVRISGWIEKGDINAITLGKKVKDMGFPLIIYTDISRDGMMKGPNLTAIRKMAHSTGIPVIAAGGISSIEDVKKIKRLNKDGVIGVISGKAIYDGRINVRKAINILK